MKSFPVEFNKPKYVRAVCACGKRYYTWREKKMGSKTPTEPDGVYYSESEGMCRSCEKEYHESFDSPPMPWSVSGDMGGWECLYAGLDVDGILKVFTIGPDGRPRHIDHQHWLDIRAACLPGIEAGEMPIVSLRLEKKKVDAP